MAKKPSGTWYSIRMRPEDKGEELLQKLQDLLTAEKGVNVSKSDAVRIALEEAIAKRKRK